MATDAKVLGLQTGVEITHQIIVSALSGADLVHDVGLMDHCSMISPELLVLADEVIAELRKLEESWFKQAGLPYRYPRLD